MTRRWLLTSALTCIFVSGCSKDRESTRPAVQVGGANVITLARERSGDDLQFLGADILPGRGWNTYQIRAWLPGRGDIQVLTAPSLEEAATKMNGGADDRIGNQSFTVGGAILIPYANRITGQLSPGNQELTTLVEKQTVKLPANWGGKQPGAHKYAMHGLILDAKVQPGAVTGTSAEGSLNAGDFRGHWVSNTQLHFKTEIEKNRFILEVVAKNTGSAPLPIGIGWHPYFRIPSGQREQAHLQLPASERYLANNYDEVLPTGKVETVAGTPYDFTASGGRAMDKLFLDDAFVGLKKEGEKTVSAITDPLSKYGIRIIADAPEVTAIQVYAPPEKSFIVLEPQFNWADPYNPLWKNRKTGMTTLQPGASVTYTVHLELFQP